MQSDEARAFWSYVHTDDEAEGGRIVELAYDVRRQYGLLTGGALSLFLDKDAISWGDDWRERIAEALSAATFFIPIMTPRYFDSAECRRELIFFAREAKKLGVQSLLLPILYVPVPDLEENELADEALTLVKPRQYVHWTELRLEDQGSPAYRKGVARLAKRLADTVVEVSKAPMGAEGIGAEVYQAEVVDEEAPGFLELIVAGEEALPRWTGVIEEVGVALEKLTEVATAGAAEMQTSDVRGGGAAGRLRMAALVASRLRKPADEIVRLGEQNTREAEHVDGAVGAIFDAIEDNPPTEAVELAQAEALFNAVEEMVAAAATGTTALGELSVSLSEVSKAARVMRPVARDLQRGLRGFVDAQAVYNDWVRRIREIRERLMPPEQGQPDGDTD